MNIRQIRENLGRVRTSFQRNEMVRAVNCFVEGLRALGGSPPPTDLRGDIREALQLPRTFGGTSAKPCSFLSATNRSRRFCLTANARTRRGRKKSCLRFLRKSTTKSRKPRKRKAAKLLWPEKSSSTRPITPEKNFWNRARFPKRTRALPKPCSHTRMNTVFST